MHSLPHSIQHWLYLGEYGLYEITCFWAKYFTRVGILVGERRELNHILSWEMILMQVSPHLPYLNSKTNTCHHFVLIPQGNFIFKFHPWVLMSKASRTRQHFWWQFLTLLYTSLWKNARMSWDCISLTFVSFSPFQNQKEVGLSRSKATGFRWETRNLQ